MKAIQAEVFVLNSCRKIIKGAIFLLATIVAVLGVSALSTHEENKIPAVSAGIGEGDRYHFLLVGRDEAAGLTDVMMLVSVDKGNGRMCLAQIPRDTYFRYTEKDYKKINGAMSTLGGADSLCRALERAFSTEIDAYIVLDLDFLVTAVDMIGGVTLDVPCDMDYEDPSQDLSIHLKKGRQVLDGAAAAEFIRFRSGYLRGDLGRMDAQKLFMSAFLEAAKDKLGNHLPHLVLSAMRSVSTNMRVDQILSLARMMRSMDGSSVTLLTLPGEEVQSSVSGAWYYVLSRSGTAKVLEEHFGVTGASACIDPAHLFSNVGRREFESVYRREIQPQYYTVSEIREHGLASPSN